MRKLLGFLVAAVFVATAATSAMAITITTDTTGNGKGFFQAEWSFIQTGDASFGFELLRMAGNKPAPGDVAAPKIDWQNVVNVVAGSDTFRPSFVYAKIANQAYTANTTVLFYTDNVNPPSSITDPYKYVIVSTAAIYEDGSADSLNALVEKDGAGQNTSSGNSTLPLSFRLHTQDSIDNGTFNVMNANFSNNTDPSTTLEQSGGNMFFVTDKSSTGFDPLDYAVLSKTGGMKEWDYYANSGVEDWYMFFASNFRTARMGYSYGTDALTVELIVTP
ncbi:MAG: hypothetical protein FWH43_07190 [Endomicrobia bacterium]|nr:hypothetical protein [Endomicrobiia bacterium]